MGVYKDIKTGLEQAIEQEQINKIAKDLCSKYDNCTCDNRDGHCSTPQRDAKIIYNLGYRKEEDTIKEIQRRIKDAVNNPVNTSINIRTAVGMEMLVNKVLVDYLREIKNSTTRHLTIKSSEVWD